ncbi:hypothetical protein EJB05_49120, partial [Eragrostis curvula]
MAVANGVVPSPPPPPPPASRNIAASLARRHLVRAAADAATGAAACLFFAGLWFVGVGAALSVVGRRACGEGSPLVAAASRVIHIAAVTECLAGPVGLVLLVTRIALSTTEAEEGDLEQVTTEKSLAELLNDTIMRVVIAAFAFLILVVIGELLRGLPPVKGSRRERVGSAISDVGAVGAEALFCFIIVPISALRIWRSWRMRLWL